MYEVGRICLKIAGRDAGRQAVIVDILENKMVLIDGNVRRRKCNVLHLEPTSKKIDIKKKATHEEVAEAFSKHDLAVWQTTPKKAAEKPVKVRTEKPVVEEKKPVKKEVKKAVKKEDKKVEAKPAVKKKAA